MLNQGGYWLFVIGFMVGVYLKTIPKYPVVVGILLTLFEKTLQPYLVFLQAGILSGIAARVVL